MSPILEISKLLSLLMLLSLLIFLLQVHAHRRSARKRERWAGSPGHSADEGAQQGRRDAADPQPPLGRRQDVPGGATRRHRRDPARHLQRVPSDRLERGA